MMWASEEEADMPNSADVKTNAMRLLDTRGVPYTTHTFSTEIHSAEGVAQAVGIAPERVFKTLVVVPTPTGRRPYLAIVPATGELDLKKLANAAGEKKLRMASHKQAEQLTGLQVGGISPLALLNRGFRVLLERCAREHDTILVSAGKRGINLELPVAALIEITGARVADLVRRRPAI
jgi:Cys-tRNA(Pro)/Cys-tRNA(Cys) deacylase